MHNSLLLTALSAQCLGARYMKYYEEIISENILPCLSFG